MKIIQYLPVLLLCFLVGCAADEAASTIVANVNPSSPVRSESILAGVTYKPFASEHNDKFSLGDFDSPYLVRLNDYTSFAPAGSRIILNNVTNEITKTDYQGGTYVGIAGFRFSDYTSFISTNAILTIKVSLVASDGSVIADGAAARNLTVSAATNLYTWQDLQGMKHDLTADYRLRNSVTFPDRGMAGLAREGFDPVGDDRVGDDSDNFTGSFAGGGHGITNLSIERGSRNNVGIWGYVDGAASVIKDFVLDHAGIRGNNNVGAVVGQLLTGTVSNVGVVSSENSNVSGNTHIGGLVAWNSGTVAGYVRGAVAGMGTTVNVGGLVGNNLGTVVGYVRGAVAGMGTTVNVGGLVGNNLGTVVGYATGRISGTGNVGGLVGLNIVSPLNSATVNGYWDIGSTGLNNSAGGTTAVSISAIANVVYDGTADTYMDGSTQVFDDATFLMHFDLPGRGGAWPTLRAVP